MVNVSQTLPPDSHQNWRTQASLGPAQPEVFDWVEVAQGLGNIFTTKASWQKGKTPGSSNNLNRAASHGGNVNTMPMSLDSYLPRHDEFHSQLCASGCPIPPAWPPSVPPKAPTARQLPSRDHRACNSLTPSARRRAGPGEHRRQDTVVLGYQ